MERHEEMLSPEEQYVQLAPTLDADGFSMYAAAEEVTGLKVYEEFPYEDNHGMFEMADGHTLLRYLEAAYFGTITWEIVPYALQRIRNVMNRNQLCVVPPKSSETEQKSPVSLHIIFGFSQARTATQSTPYPVPNEMPLEDQDELSLSPKQLAWPRYLLWRRPQW